MKISTRIAEMAESETLAMSAKSAQLKTEGRDVINLALGEPDFATPSFIRDYAKKSIDDGYTHYPPVSGYQDLKEAICLKLKRDNAVDFKPNQIVVSNGAKHSITNLVFSLVNLGDEVIVPAPYWVSYPEIVKLAGGIPVIVKAGVEQDFKVTAAQIEVAITPKTKAIFFNSPSNPTGSVYTFNEMKAIAEMLAKYPEIVMISDEIYELINFSAKHTSMAAFPQIKNQLVIVNGVAKGWAMTGWRIGYIAAPLEIAQACSKCQGQMTSACSSIAQRATIAAMLQDPTESVDLKEMVATFKKRRDIALRMLKEIKGVKLSIPDGAFYIFMDISELLEREYDGIFVKSAADLTNLLLEKTYVGMVGGDSFGNNKCIRVSYATSEEKLIEACNRLQRFFNIK
ncbi:MAG: pyridoxal phosphate-dependent aminotransferase [Bacteroidales bacterium]|jgi:aspartate aminotransferase|nr:pyridoxal phosphate-dependent aminotransferase [Bacteroidales bacterium]